MSSCITSGVTPTFLGTRVTREVPVEGPQMDREYKDGAKTKSPQAWPSMFTSVATIDGFMSRRDNHWRQQGLTAADATWLAECGIMPGDDGDKETVELETAAFAGRLTLVA